MAAAPLDAPRRHTVLERARELVLGARARRDERQRLDAFLEEYGLTSDEGVVLLCLAEALLRIPDAATVDALIADRLPLSRWTDHLGHSEALLVNASTWALMLTGRVLAPPADAAADATAWLRGLMARLGEPLVRRAVISARRILGPSSCSAKP